MENITTCSFDYHNEQKRLIDFLVEYRAAADVRMYPTIWRIRLLLTSRVWEQDKDSQIWEDASGKIIAFAMLWSRNPADSYLVLDGFLHPQRAAAALLEAVLRWGSQRAVEIAEKRGVALTLYASGFSQHPSSIDPLKQLGFSPPVPNPAEHNVYFAKQLQLEITPPMLPAGYGIHTLRDANCLESYQSLYGFSKVDPHHLKETIASGEYSHLVVVDQAGELAAYCECSVCLAEWERTGYKIGWIDYIGTRPGQQNKGLGQAVLAAGLMQLKEWRADTAMLVTTNTNIPAVGLYQKAGFEVVELSEHPGYQKLVVPTRAGRAS